MTRETHAASSLTITVIANLIYRLREARAVVVFTINYFTGLTRATASVTSLLSVAVAMCTSDLTIVTAVSGTADFSISAAVVAVYDGTVGVRCCCHADKVVLATQRLERVIRVSGYKCLYVRNGSGGHAELLDHILAGCFGLTYCIIQYGILEAFTRIMVMVDLPGRLGFE